MKLIFVLLFGLLHFGLQAQIAMPLKSLTTTHSINMEGIEIYNVPSFDNDQMNRIYNDCNGDGVECNYYAKQISADIKPYEKGTWRVLPDGRKIWRIKIYSPTAFGFHVLSNNFHLPKGAALFFYNETKTNTYGAYTAFNNKEHKMFCSSAIYENPLVVELNLPAHVSENDWSFDINALGYIYTSSEDIGNALECQDDVACQPWWTEWCNQIRSVVKITIKTERRERTTPELPIDTIFSKCTGVIINDWENDAPQNFKNLKILTAAHCAVGIECLAENACTYHFYRIQPELWMVYYNFQYVKCNNQSNVANDKMTTQGVKVLYNTESPELTPIPTGRCPDIALLEITDEIPFQYNLYYSGWTTADAEYELSSLNTTFIHHPKGDLKKVGEGLVNVQNREFDKDCWVIENTIGAPEGGSSGCPYYDNENKRIIGVQSQFKSGVPGCLEGQSQPSRVGKVGKAWSLGLKDYIGNYGASDGTDPFQACISDLAISGYLYPSSDWQSKTDIKIQAKYITSPANINLQATVTQSSFQFNNIYADYTFQAVNKVRLIPGFAVERGNVFRGKIAPCEPFITDCGINYEARTTIKNDTYNQSIIDVLSKQNENMLQLQPNPSSGQVNVILPQSGGTISLYDALGQQVLKVENTETMLELNLLGKQAGIYIVHWRLGTWAQAQKLILQ